MLMNHPSHQAALKAIAAALLMVPAFLAAESTPPTGATRHIILFLTEDQSPHLGCLGTKGLDTPHLDNLGTSGVIFARAFSLSPVCSPSKMALFTGTYPHTNGGICNVRNYGTDFPLKGDPSDLSLGGVRENLPTLIEILRTRGWHTAISSKTHVQPIRKFPYHQGFPNPKGGLLADGGVTHVDPKSIDVPASLPDVPGVRQDFADYYGAIESFDLIYAAARDSLAEHGLLDRSLVVFTSDHGIGLHRFKQSIYGLHVPLLIDGPGIRGGRRIKAPISHLDLAPTFLEFAGIDIPPSMLEKSLLSALAGAPDIPGRRIFPGGGRFSPPAMKNTTRALSAMDVIISYTTSARSPEPV